MHTTHNASSAFYAPRALPPRRLPFDNRHMAPRKRHRRTFLEQYRKRAGLTQDELAAKSGVSQGTICRIEGGNQDTTLKTLDKLAKHLGCDGGDILSVDPAQADPLADAWRRIPEDQRSQALRVLESFTRRKPD
jgi:transcriptional regulator with XRE-family HTH domain